MKGREAFQEIDYRAYFGTVAKWVTEIEAVDRIPEIIARAWTTAISGRPGPVVVALPEDMLTDVTDVPALTGPAPVHEPGPMPDAIAAVVSKLSAAERPLILIGGGGWRAEGSTALQRFAEAADIPVIAAFRFQDILDNHSPSYVGDAGTGMTPATRAQIQGADVILAIGVRFGEMTTDGYTLLNVPKPDQTLIHVHASDREIGKVYIADLGVQSGPNAFAQAMSQQGVQGRWADWRAKARADYEAFFDLPDLPSPVDMGKVSAYLRDSLPEDAILTNGAGNFTVWPNKFFKYGPNQRLLAPQSGAMGYGLPAAVAAKVAHPDRTVVCFAGDGDFPDELSGAWNRHAGRGPAHRIDPEQRHIRHHSDASGKSLSCPRLGHDVGEPGFRGTRAVLRLPC